jgi:hypothetical protein
MTMTQQQQQQGHEGALHVLQEGQQQQHSWHGQRQEHRGQEQRWQQQQLLQADSPVLAMWSLARMDVLPTWSEDVALYQGWLHDLQKVLVSGVWPAAPAVVEVTAPVTGRDAALREAAASSATGHDEPANAGQGQSMVKAQQQEQQKCHHPLLLQPSDRLPNQIQGEELQHKHAALAMAVEEAVPAVEASIPRNLVWGGPSDQSELLESNLSLHANGQLSSSSNGKCTSITECSSSSSNSSSGTICAGAAHASSAHAATALRAAPLSTSSPQSSTASGGTQHTEAGSRPGSFVGEMDQYKVARQQHMQQQQRQESQKQQVRPLALTSEQCSMVIAALGRLRSPSWVLPELMPYWLQQTRQQLAAAKPGELACWLWGLGRLRYRPPDAWVQGYLGRVRGVMQDLRPQEVVMLLWGLNRLQVRVLPCYGLTDMIW